MTFRTNPDYWREIVAWSCTLGVRATRCSDASFTYDDVDEVLMDGWNDGDVYGVLKLKDGRYAAIREGASALVADSLNSAIGAAALTGLFSSTTRVTLGIG